MIFFHFSITWQYAIVMALHNIKPIRFTEANDKAILIGERRNMYLFTYITVFKNNSRATSTLFRNRIYLYDPKIIQSNF